jgi:arylsulfatase A-like enzyme
MNRRQFFRYAGASALALGGSDLLLRSQAGGKLNVVFILIDDMGWRDLTCYGSRFYETPNIDTLASQGMRFTNAYAACPVCSPTRASIMTGKYPARLHLTDWIPGRKQWPTARLLTPKFNQQLPLEEITIAEALKPEGYATASIGKWHLGGDHFLPQDQGFDLNVAGTQAGSTRSYFAPYPATMKLDAPAGEYLTDRLTDEAIKFVTANQKRPFFLYLPHYTVHEPLQAKQPIIERYRAKKPVDAQKDPTYAAMIDSLDQGVGRLMKTLDDLKLTGKTVVFFMSDNGGLVYEGRSKEPVTSNAPLRAGKGHLYEGGIREPMFVRWPGVIAPGSVCDVPVSSVDFYPTILEMAGVRKNPARNVDGVSIMPLLRQSGSLKRDALYWHYPHYSNQGGVPGGAVRKGDYKLIEFYGTGRVELYNLKSDIGERNDLAKAEPQKTAELSRMLHDWRKSVDAAMPVPNPNYDPAKAGQGLTGADAQDLQGD